MNELRMQKKTSAAKNRQHWLPWYFIAWRIIWWVPTWVTLAVFCVLKGIYCISIDEARSAWNNET